MARKVTPLYAETLILLKVWALDETPASKSKFISSSTKAYVIALKQLVTDGALSETPKNKRTNVYDITHSGKSKLAQGLANEAFSFSSVAGPKTTNALLKWFRQGSSDVEATDSTNTVKSAAKNGAANGHRNGSAAISSYEAFTKTALQTYDQLNRDYNLDDLVPIYRIRRELGDRLPRQKFNEWLLETQSNDLVQLMGSDISNVTPDQMEDSITIPGAGARFFVKRL